MLPKRMIGMCHMISIRSSPSLPQLEDSDVTRILTFVVAQTLPCGSAMVEGLGNGLGVDMASHWQPDQAFFDLMRDKPVINAMLKEVGGKITADAHIASTAKVQKKIIQDYLNGTRKGAKQDWHPRYMVFPMTGYTKRGGIEAMDNWKAVKKHYVAAYKPDIQYRTKHNSQGGAANQLPLRLPLAMLVLSPRA